jgi:hypothetical protein
MDSERWKVRAVSVEGGVARGGWMGCKYWYRALKKSASVLYRYGFGLMVIFSLDSSFTVFHY